MSFSDLFFIYFFLPICLLCYYGSKSSRTRNTILIAFSLVFYAWGGPVWVLLLLLSAAVNYIIALRLGPDKDDTFKKAFLAVALIFNIGMLLVFKYTGFFVENLNLIFRTSIPVPAISQPIGLSFYTFRAISYILDVYWGKSKAQKSFKEYLLYVSFFPHMMAGPIVRYGTMEPDLSKRRTNPMDMYEGTLRILVGLAKKVILADHLIVIADSLFGANLSGLSTIGTWYGAAIYMLYVYFDFSGYSDMAIGIARLFGFHFEENFNYPFLCRNIQEFWQRWHISLGTFFRDYLLYVPLFGKRRKYASLFLVWFCTGFWHGASWNYILWGLYYGCFVFMEEKLGRKKLKAWPVWWKHLYSMLVVVVGFGIYYFTDVKRIGQFLLNISGINLIINRSRNYFHSWRLCINFYITNIACIFCATYHCSKSTKDCKIVIHLIASTHLKTIIELTTSHVSIERIAFICSANT